MSEPTTDVDRAVAAIGGISLNYYSFGGLKITPREQSLSKLFTYNDQGEAEYHPPEPEAVAEPQADPAAGADQEMGRQMGRDQLQLPSQSAWTASGGAGELASPASPAGQDAGRPAASPGAPLGLPELWRDRRDPLESTSAIGAEQRSLAAMFNMLAGRAAVPELESGASPASEPSRSRADDTRDLFRRL